MSSLKILFITSNEPNGDDIYFKGLKAILGDRIVEYPYKPIYHLHREGDRLIGRDLEGNVVCEEDAYGDLVSKDGTWRTMKYFGCMNVGRRYDYDKLSDFSDFDAVVISSFSLGLDEVKRIVRRELNKPVFILDGFDEPLIRAIYFNEKVKRYFKREILLTPFVDRYYFLERCREYYRYHLQKWFINRKLFDANTVVFPAFKNIPKIEHLGLTIGLLDSDISLPKEKKIDISFIAYPSSRLRIKLYFFLKNYVRKRRGLTSFILLTGKFYNKEKSVIPYSKYAEIIASSKLSFAVQGAGFDTYRYWEIPFYGSALVSQKPYIFIENNFVEGESAIFFRSFKELEKKLDYYLFKDKWEEICMNGRKHFLKYHTYLHRARKILKAIEETING